MQRIIDFRGYWIVNNQTSAEHQSRTELRLTKVRRPTAKCAFWLFYPRIIRCRIFLKQVIYSTRQSHGVIAVVFMWLGVDIRNSVELPCGKICDDFDEREESLLGSRKAGKRAGIKRSRGKAPYVMKGVKLSSVVRWVLYYQGPRLYIMAMVNPSDL